jgi:signal transduction histidine kinase
MRRSAVSLKTRLIAFVTVTFAFSFVVVLGTTLLVLRSTLVRHDHAELEATLRTLEQNYELGGLKAVRREIEVTNVLGRGRPYYVRIANEENETLLESAPKGWKGFPFYLLEQRRPEALDRFHRLSSRQVEFDLEVLSTTTESELVFQVGASTRAREQELGVVVTTFAALGIPCLGLILLLLSFLIHRSLMSITDITQVVRGILRSGRYDQLVPVRHAARETDELAEAFNTLMQKVDGLIGRLRHTLDSLAHDIRTPMTRLRTQAELSLEQAKGEDALRTALHGALEESNQVIMLVERILDASEADSGAVRLNREEVALNGLLNEVAEAYEMVAEEWGVGFTFRCSAEGTAYVDAVRLRQIAGNLLDNALKHSPGGGTVTLALGSDAENVELSVSDEGAGIDSEEKTNIWSYQYRGASGHEGGYGIGLTIVRAVAEAHGGGASVQSRPGAGSTFTVTIPRHGTRNV